MQTLMLAYTLGEFKPRMCIYVTSLTSIFLCIELTHGSYRPMPQLESRIQMTFQRYCWIGVSLNFSLTTNVNSYKGKVILKEPIVLMSMFLVIISPIAESHWELSPKSKDVKMIEYLFDFIHHRVLLWGVTMNANS